MSLNAKQVEQLLRPLNPRRVQKDNSGKSHLAGYDVSAHLTRIFGFGGRGEAHPLPGTGVRAGHREGRAHWLVGHLPLRDDAGRQGPATEPVRPR